jgi:hypothetical protein
MRQFKAKYALGVPVRSIISMIFRLNRPSGGLSSRRRWPQMRAD